MADSIGGSYTRGQYTGPKGETSISGSELKVFNAGTIDDIKGKRAPFTPQEVKPYESKQAEVKPVKPLPPPPVRDEQPVIVKGNASETPIQSVPIQIDPPKPPQKPEPRTDYGLGDLLGSIFGEVLKGIFSGGGNSGGVQSGGGDAVDDWLGIDKEPVKDPEPAKPEQKPDPVDEKPPEPVEEKKPEPAKPEPEAREKLGKKTKFASVADPHVTTNDGLKFDNDQKGDFVLARSDKGDLTIQAHQGEIPGDDGVWQRNAAVKTDGDVVKYDADSNTVNINGKDYPFKAGQKIPLEGGGYVQMTADKLENGTKFNRLQVHTAQGDDVYMLNFHRKGGNYLDIVGQFSPNREKGEIAGSAGTIDGDGNPANDMRTRSGQITSDREAFIDSWRVDQKESLL